MRIVPANKASWDELEAVLTGANCHGGRCYCQRFKLAEQRDKQWGRATREWSRRGEHANNGRFAHREPERGRVRGPLSYKRCPRGRRGPKRGRGGRRGGRAGPLGRLGWCCRDSR